MYQRLLIAALLGGSVLVAGAMPAFTADSGSVGATVNVPPPPTPCITFSATAVDFGTLSFSDPQAANTPWTPATPNVRMTGCGTARQLISVSATDATTPSGSTWTVANTAFTNSCTLGPNVFSPGVLSGPSLVPIFTTPRGWVTFGPGGFLDLTFMIRMPCRGSAGAGETASFSYNLTAAVAE